MLRRYLDKALNLQLSFIVACGAILSVHADPVDVNSLGDVTITESGSEIVATSVLDNSSAVPVSVNVNTGGTATYSDLTATASGSLEFTSVLPLTSDALLFYSISDGSLGLTNSAELIWHNVEFDDASGGALITASTLLSSSSIVSSTSISHYGSLTADTSFDFSPPTLRIAAFSGIEAISTGQIGDGVPGAAGGPVIVTTYADSAINLTNTGPAALTAGISATSAVGAGEGIGVSALERTVSVGHSGSIQVSAESAVGILASSTGAQFATETDTVAFGDPVFVRVHETGSINLMGGSGIGVFAISEVYTPDDTNKSDGVQGGNVTVTLDNGATLTTGEADSTFSMGVLAVSAGSDVWVNPFDSGDINDKAGAGAGGDVTVTSDRAIQTQGQMSIGIAALSLGGESMVTTADGNSGDTSYLGNTGSTNPGAGGKVTVTTLANGSITTIGETAHGIVAISGTGGGIINNDIPQAGTTGSNATGLVIGSDSSSSDPANGGDVTVINGSAITTGDGMGGGTASIGIVAQSIGGGGGTAGGGETAAFIGDKGGPGGDASLVTVNQSATGSVTTSDVNSLGILAQSIGGGGGNGANAKGLFFAVGGNGGTGGNGGEVLSHLSGSVATSGDHSAGVVLQSIGGGGGNGGGATAAGLLFSAGIGGQGGGGGNAAEVTATLDESSSITTTGSNSAGLHLQSVGGGGGTGGSAYSFADGVIFSATIAVGGHGAPGGAGEKISGTNAGVIMTGVASASDSENLPNANGADSVGLYGQSIGGGGGHGGGAIANSFTTTIPDVPSITASISLGGSGGEGSDGGIVGLTNQGAITTNADSSPGVLGQSIGGGGGVGGDASMNSYLAGFSTAIELNLAMGGSGGHGGSANEVQLVNSSNGSSTPTFIETYGQYSTGLLAQSIGGGGGFGGYGNGTNYTPSYTGDSNTYDISMMLGGTGGDGGSSGLVIVDNHSPLTTHGSSSMGILAQSIGGGGGLGGGTNGGGSNNTMTVNVGVGGDGGQAGAGGEVDVTNTDAITTSGGDAVGILAQSIGGGGGDGGSTDSTATIGPVGEFVALLAPSKAWTANISVGGAGGSGNASGAVAVTNDSGASIQTAGNRAFGVLAQSVSGGGGRGGAATASSNSTFFFPIDGVGQYTANVAVGGNGGSSPIAANTQVTNSGSITTTGYGAHGVVAQSVGGGGGVGGNGSVDIAATLALGVAGSGAKGSDGSGGQSTVTQLGALSTTGGNALGILAQSIGGGGGVASSGDDVTPYMVSHYIYPVLRTDFQLGYDRSTSTFSDGGSTIIDFGDDTNYSTVDTAGVWSFGLVAQSIGSGGGLAGSITGAHSTAYSGIAAQLGAEDGQGAGGTATLTLGSNSKVTTQGYGASGIVLQSIGGGGGIATDSSQNQVQAAAVSGKTNPGVQLGATSGNVNGSGSSVLLDGYGQVSTAGDNAHGVILQSIGGGGGIFGAGNGLAADTGLGDAVTMNLGMKGDVGGHGLDVSVTDAQLTVTTTGENAFGLVAQSIGGGGGIATATNGGAITLGGDGSDERAGGTVTLSLAAGSSISTSGAGSHGLIVQSIGGGGGIANPDTSSSPLAANTSYRTSGEANGYGANVMITTNGMIEVSGSGAIGMVAQVIGGGGGLFANLAGSTGNSSSSTDGSNNGVLNITQNGTLRATGDNAFGIFAQNVTANGHGGNQINLTINGEVQGGGSDGAGIWIDGGSSNNSIIIAASAMVHSLSELAILTGGEGSTFTTNYGTVAGSLYLGNDNGSVGSFTNYGLLQTGNYLYAAIDNNSQISIGLDPSSGMATELRASFQQNETGSISFDVAGLTNYDTLSFIDGSSGIFYGSITATFVDEYRPMVNDRFTLIDGLAAENYSGSFLASFNVNGLPAGYAWLTGFDSNDNYYFEITAVPEVRDFALLAGLTMLAIVGWRRRR